MGCIDKATFVENVETMLLVGAETSATVAEGGFFDHVLAAAGCLWLLAAVGCFWLMVNPRGRLQPPPLLQKVAPRRPL